MKHNIHNVSILYLITIFLVILVGGGLYFNEQNEKIRIDEINTINKTAQTGNTQDQYKTHKNSVIGVEFKYPSTWPDLTQEIEFCWDKSTNSYSKETCKLYLGTESGGNFWDSRFLAAINEKFPTSAAGRGASYDDYGKAPNSTKDFCNGWVTGTSCVIYKNSNQIDIAKVIIDYPSRENSDCIEGCFGHKVLYYIKNQNAEFPVLIFSTTSDEKTLDKIVDSLKFI